MLRITEILPNPKGPDTGQEFIEITNFADSAINLKGFTLDDGEKGSKPYEFTEDTVLQANSSKAFYNSQTKIALNNTSDSARLFDHNGELVDEIKYDKTKEGLSYSLIEILSPSKSKTSIIQTDPSPNQPNDKLYKIIGTITEASPETQFTLTEEYSQKEITITYSSVTKELSTLTFASGTEISILASKKNSTLDSKNSTPTFDLIDFLILKTASQKQAEIPQHTAPSHLDIPFPALTFPIIIIFIILILLIKRNRAKTIKQF